MNDYEDDAMDHNNFVTIFYVIARRWWREIKAEIHCLFFCTVVFSITAFAIFIYGKNCKSRIMRQSTVHTWFTVTSREKIKAKSPQFVQKRTRLLWEEDKCGQLM